MPLTELLPTRLLRISGPVFLRIGPGQVDGPRLRPQSSTQRGIQRIDVDADDRAAGIVLENVVQDDRLRTANVDHGCIGGPRPLRSPPPARRFWSNVELVIRTWA